MRRHIPLLLDSRIRNWPLALQYRGLLGSLGVHRLCWELSMNLLVSNWWWGMMGHVLLWSL
jgi:hypothetical protein